MGREDRREGRNPLEERLESSMKLPYKQRFCVRTLQHTRRARLMQLPNLVSKLAALSCLRWLGHYSAVGKAACNPIGPLYQDLQEHLKFHRNRFAESARAHIQEVNTSAIWPLAGATATSSLHEYDNYREVHDHSFTGRRIMTWSPHHCSSRNILAVAISFLRPDSWSGPSSPYMT